jgi:hypothetical protein
MPPLAQPEVGIDKYHQVVRTTGKIKLVFTLVWKKLSPNFLEIDTKTTPPDIGIAIPSLAGWVYEKGLFLPTPSALFSYATATQTKIDVTSTSKTIKRKLLWREPKAGEVVESEEPSSPSGALAEDEKIAISTAINVINGASYGFSEEPEEPAGEIVLDLTGPSTSGLAMLL